MPLKRRRQKGRVRTRLGILNALKEGGPSDSCTLARRLGVSTMAVRQHIYGLLEQNLVTYQEERRPVGRPAKVWRLKPSADRFFHDGHAHLTVSLIRAVDGAFGKEGLDRLLAVRARQQWASLKKLMPPGGSLGDRVAALADIRANDGYLAEFRNLGNGSFLFIENHCPIRIAAAVCNGLCDNEHQLFAKILGPQFSISRTEHILAGERRCAYRITPSNGV